MEVIDDVACCNSDCPQLGVVGGGNIILRRLYGADQIRFVRCRACKKEFSERRGSAFFGLRLAEKKIIAVVAHLAEGVGVRKTARLTKVSRDTVGRILNAVGEHAKAVHDWLVYGLDCPEVQLDEMWSFVKKKTRTSPKKSGKTARLAASGTTRRSMRAPS